MKRSILLAVSLLLLTPPLDASKQCLKPVKCPSGKTTNCCEAPPCEYFFELKVAKTILNLYSSDAQRSALSGDPREQAKHEADLNNAVRKVAQEFADCPAAREYTPTPFLTALPDQQCRITVYDGTAEVDTNQLKAEGDMCDELIDAEYAKATAQQQNCQAGLERASNASLQEGRRQGAREIEARADLLQSNLTSYWGACSDVADAATARLAAQAGLVALKKTPPTTKPARRSANGHAQGA